MATLALFVALGGSSYAALKVTGKNVKDSSLTGKDIKPNSVTGDDVKSLGSADFKAGGLAVGPRGPQGPTGAGGPPGPSGASLPELEAVVPVQPGSANDNCTSLGRSGEFCRQFDAVRPSIPAQWLNVGSGYAAAGFFKDGSGLVHLRGSVRTNGADIPAPIFVLPVGFRPSSAVRFGVHAEGGGTTESEYVEVAANGRVTPKTRTTTTYLALDDVSFRP